MGASSRLVLVFVACVVYRDRRYMGGGEMNSEQDGQMDGRESGGFGARLCYLYDVCLAVQLSTNEDEL